MSRDNCIAHRNLKIQCLFIISEAFFKHIAFFEKGVKVHRLKNGSFHSPSPEKLEEKAEQPKGKNQERKENIAKVLLICFRMIENWVKNLILLMQ